METALNQTKRETALINASDLVHKMDYLKEMYRCAKRIELSVHGHKQQQAARHRANRLETLYEGLVSYYNGYLMDAIILERP
jgi:hypothetical protein